MLFLAFRLVALLSIGLHRGVLPLLRALLSLLLTRFTGRDRHGASRSRSPERFGYTAHHSRELRAELEAARQGEVWETGSLP